MYILTANADLSNIKVALNLCKDHIGVHWSYQPDGKRLIGYGYRPTGEKPNCLMEVNEDGTGYHPLSTSTIGGGHPSRHPFLDHLVMTDRYQGELDHFCMIDLRTDRVVWNFAVPEANGVVESGRNPSHVDNHPVFSRDGRSVWLNRMENGLAQLVRVDIPEGILNA